MGRIVKGKDYYISDRGIREKLDEMQVSHLINAIAHHQKQYDVLKSMTYEAQYNTEFVMQKSVAIWETITKLKGELARRKEDDNKEYNCSQDKMVKSDGYIY